MSNQTPESVPLTDPGNPYINEYPGSLTVGLVNGPRGQRLVVTLRVGGGTLTALVDRNVAKTWAAQIESGADGMTGLIVPNGFPPPNGHMP